MLFRGRARRAMLAAFFAAALGLRLVEIGNPLYYFAATRQHHSVLIARALYNRLRSDAPTAQKRVSEVQYAKRERLEPPITEGVVAAGYWVCGHETPVVPRVLTSLFWLSGGAIVYLLGLRLLSADAALITLAYFLFLPFGVIASRSFQPDPLMILTTLGALLAIVEQDRRPDLRSSVLAGLAIAAALLVKPMGLFLLVAAFASLTLRRLRLSAFTDRFVWTTAGVAALPVAVYYAPGLLQTGFLSGQAERSLMPELWTQRVFWAGWTQQLRHVFGLGPVVVALLGAALVAKGLPRLLLLALWLGYATFGLVFTYHISSHDYYQLQLVPVIALSLGALCQPLLATLAARAPAVGRGTVLASLAIAGCFGYAAPLRDNDALGTLAVKSPQAIAVYAEIGRRVGHSEKVVFLSPDSYGGPLQTYGELAGWYWPTFRQQRAAEHRGHGFGNAVERLGEYRRQGATYFVSTSRSELANQPRVQRWLQRKVPLVAHGDDYVIYDLRSEPARRDSSGPAAAIR
jgi:hypothetical protein